MDRSIIVEWNVVCADIMMAPLDSIHESYLHNCACVVLTRLFRLFYANLEVVQDDDGWFVSPLWKDMLSLVILKSSISALGCLCSRFLSAHTMR
jgi:hypothetical protein